MDHVSPVIDPVKGFTTWDDFINRMFCDELGFQCLCVDCHNLKTKAENKVRREYKKLDKLKDKK